MRFLNVRMASMIFAWILFFEGIGVSKVLASDGAVTASVSTASKTAEMSNGIIKMSVNSKGQVSTFALNGTNFLGNGGPMKQDLMVHGTSKTPLALKMLQSEHFGTGAPYYNKGEEKIYGPYFIYANSGTNRQSVIEDAASYAEKEQSKWPYSWMKNSLYSVQLFTFICLKGELQI